MAAKFSLLGLLAAPALAAPVADAVLDARAPAQVTNAAQLSSSLAALSSGPATAFAAGYTNLMQAIVPQPTPTDVAGLETLANSAQAAYPSNPLAYGAALLLSGAAGNNPIGNPATDVSYFGPCNGDANVNPPPRTPVYPRKGPNDAPYDVSEASLRSAIYIPSGFTYGKKPPVLFAPGTGVEACENFSPNIAKVIGSTNYADPVFINVPANVLVDEQVSAEYIAYAVNYIASLTGSNVSLISWSAGGPVAQWAFKYWPSTRSVTNDFIAISPDFHGTIEVPLICPPGTPCDPGVLQQLYTSNWISVLRANGGSNAYVPTTEIHSIFDEIVEPQQDPLASADIGSGNGVPATNAQVQSICPPGTPAGGPNFGHENSLYNAVAVQLVMDALQHPGPANIARSGAANNCSQFYANGLTLSDVFASEFLIPLAGFNIEAFPNKTTTEPPIKPYAAT